MAFLIQKGSLERTTHGAIIMSSMESMKISKYGVDQKNNMIDDDSNGIIDDADELETSPPYPVPLRGLEVRIRIYDTSTRQVRQVTVRHTFVPH